MKRSRCAQSLAGSWRELELEFQLASEKKQRHERTLGGAAATMWIHGALGPRAHGHSEGHGTLSLVYYITFNFRLALFVGSWSLNPCAYWSLTPCKYWSLTPCENLSLRCSLCIRWSLTPCKSWCLTTEWFRVKGSDRTGPLSNQTVF